MEFVKVSRKKHFYSRRIAVPGERILIILILTKFNWCCLILINVAWRWLIMGDIDWFWLVLIDWLADWLVDWLLFDCWVVMMMRCWWRGWPWWMMMAMRDDDHGRQDHDDNASILTHKVKVELFVLINSTSCPLSALFEKTGPHVHVIPRVYRWKHIF